MDDQRPAGKDALQLAMDAPAMAHLGRNIYHQHAKGDTRLTGAVTDLDSALAHVDDAVHQLAPLVGLLPNNEITALLLNYAAHVIKGEKDESTARLAGLNYFQIDPGTAQTIARSLIGLAELAAAWAQRPPEVPETSE